MDVVAPASLDLGKVAQEAMLAQEEEQVDSAVTQEEGAQVLAAQAVADVQKTTCDVGVQADMAAAHLACAEDTAAVQHVHAAPSPLTALANALTCKQIEGRAATPKQQDDVEAQVASAAPQPLSVFAPIFLPPPASQEQPQHGHMYAASHVSSSDVVSGPPTTRAHYYNTYAPSDHSNSHTPPSPAAPSYVHRTPKDHNSVTIKHDTTVKDAAGAIFKVVDRLGVAFVTALRVEPTHEALNRAVKSIAVARKYVQDTVAGFEVTFLPLHRQDRHDVTRSDLFAFLVSKTRVGAPPSSSHPDEQQLQLAMAGGASCAVPGGASAQLAALKMADQTDLNVSRSSDVNKMANAIISIVLDREQAVMKAGGAEAVYVAMSAVINARRRLQARRGADLMLVPSFITEDTQSTLGRESKFLRFNIMRCEPNGPKSNVHPSLSSYEGPLGHRAAASAAFSSHRHASHGHMLQPAFAGAM